MQVGDEFVVMVETTITANSKTIENPIIRVTRPQAEFNPRIVYFVDNQTVGQPRHWYVGDGNGNVVVSEIDVVNSTISAALATALTNKLTAAGFLSSQHTSTVNDVPSTYNRNVKLNVITLNEAQINEKYAWNHKVNDAYILAEYTSVESVSLATVNTGNEDYLLVMMPNGNFTLITDVDAYISDIQNYFIQLSDNESFSVDLADFESENEAIAAYSGKELQIVI